MYQEITEFRRKPEEVIGMFSEALRIMDRNTTKYMIDELHDQLNAALQKETELSQALSDKKQAIDDQSRTIDDKNRIIDDQSRTIDDQSRIIDDKDKVILELQQNITELNKMIAELMDPDKEVG